MTENNKVVLAFSGGLDTTYCCVYLAKIKHMQVHSVTVNTGGFSQKELSEIETHALKLGVASHHTINAEDDFYNSCIKYMVYGNVLKNNTYPLSVSAERICQATAIADYAIQNGAAAIAHGSTGAGNDQVRFDMVFNTVAPGLEVITPVRDNHLSRQQEIDFLATYGVNVDFAKAAYSINKGLWGTSVGGVETLTSHQPLPETAWPQQVTATGSSKLELAFNKGELAEVNGQRYPNRTAAIRAVEAIAAPYGIGRDMHVGDTIIGIKGRVAFAAAAATLIIKAHHLLEKHVLVKWQQYFKNQLAEFYGNYLHEGHLHDPVMRDIEAFFESTQQTVTGSVYLTLYPHRFTLDGINSPNDLMAAEFGSYGETHRGYTGSDVKGFTRIAGNQTRIWHHVNKLNNG